MFAPDTHGILRNLHIVGSIRIDPDLNSVSIAVCSGM